MLTSGCFQPFTQAGEGLIGHQPHLLVLRGPPSPSGHDAPPHSFVEGGRATHAPERIAFLSTAADTLCEQVADDHGGVLIHLTEDAEGSNIGLKPLDGLHPTEYLLGSVVPDDWMSLGVATRGRARPMDRDGRP